MNTTAPHPLVPALLEAFGQVYDPEFGVSSRDLGRIYYIAGDESAAVLVKMTLTSMYCPAGDVILEGVRSAAERVPGVASARVDLVWEPLWTPEMLSPQAREQLGWDRPRVSD